MSCHIPVAKGLTIEPETGGYLACSVGGTMDVSTTLYKKHTTITDITNTYNDKLFKSQERKNPLKRFDDSIRVGTSIAYKKFVLRMT